MSCESIYTLEGAMRVLPSSVLPIGGLRTNSNGDLTDDALRTIVDGLKSRGIDPTDKETRQKLLKDLSVFLCSVNNQYSFLLEYIQGKISNNENVPDTVINAAKEKNRILRDILNVSGYLKHLKSYHGDTEFIEGWQNSVSSTDTISGFQDAGCTNCKALQAQYEILDNKSYVELRKRTVAVTEEKNKVANNYLGLYGFMNLVAIGLLIYVAGISKNV